MAGPWPTPSPGVLRSPKVAVLTDPANTPQMLGAALVAHGCGPRMVVVASRLGEDDEQVTRTDLAGLAAGGFDPLSVVLLVEPDAAADEPSISWGRPEDEFAHRAGMITKSEVRAVALGQARCPGPACSGMSGPAAGRWASRPPPSRLACG